MTNHPADWISVKQLMTLHCCHQMKVLGAVNAGAVRTRREAGRLEIHKQDFADWIAFHPVKPRPGRSGAPGSKAKKRGAATPRKLTAAEVRRWLAVPENVQKLTGGKWKVDK